MKFFTLDRFENNLAVLLDENGVSHIEPLERIFPAREGDVLVFDGENYLIDIKQTEERKKEAKSLIDALFQ